jgi:hypothetical protein
MAEQRQRTGMDIEKASEASLVVRREQSAPSKHCPYRWKSDEEAE